MIEDTATRRSRIIRYDGRGWPDAPPRAYKDRPGRYAGVTRRLLADSASAAFEVRYFEVGPGGCTAYERHGHEHVVVCLHGRGHARLPDGLHDVGFGDVVHVAAGEPHQFLNPDANQPFGFLCIVDRERDRPESMGE